VRGTQPFTGHFAEIRFEGVRYQHADTPAPCLDGLSFSLRQGERLALAGPSGAGKSTVVNLLILLFEPQSGRITVDGVPLPQIDRADWLAHVAIAGQDAELLEGTIVENILGTIIEGTPPLIPPNLGVTMADIEAAARAVGLMALAARLPEGLHTWVGSQGTNLSGGERQRVGLARAILRRPELLILDEATSALDVVSEAEIYARILEVMAGGTILVISHRPQALDWVDRIVRIAEGCTPDRADRSPVAIT
jgi:ABC-type multidrug transport system fused ATPase/permease subunit